MIIPSQLLKFIHIAERLKNELRHGRTSSDKHESVAEHSWRMCLMVILFSKFIDKDISLERVLKMAIIHDLPEALTGDKPYFVFEGKPDSQSAKHEEELAAMRTLTDLLPKEIGDELLNLWEEYEQGLTYEAKLVKSIDKIEAQIQHNEMSFANWNEHDLKHASTRLDRYCEFDSFLLKIKEIVQSESLTKINQGI